MKLKQTISLISLLILVTAVPLGLSLIRRQTQYKAPAAAYSANLSFTPESASLPPNAFFKIMIDPQNHPLVFARLSFTFDPSLVHLTALPQLVSSLSDVIILTPLDQANQSGTTTIAVALPPAKTPLTNIFELANFSLAPVSSAAATTNLSIKLDNSQLVHQDGSVFSLNSVNSTLTLIPTNSNLTPTPQPTIILSPTSTPTATPTISSRNTCLAAGGSCASTCVSPKVQIGTCLTNLCCK